MKGCPYASLVGLVDFLNSVFWFSTIQRFGLFASLARGSNEDPFHDSRFRKGQQNHFRKHQMKINKFNNIKSRIYTLEDSGLWLCITPFIHHSIIFDLLQFAKKRNAKTGSNNLKVCFSITDLQVESKDVAFPTVRLFLYQNMSDEWQFLVYSL